MPVGNPTATIMLNIPRILFFSTYTLLVLFWAEIIHRVRNQATSFTLRLRSIFLTVNLIIYIIQILFWVLLFLFAETNDMGLVMNKVENSFFAFLSILAATSFIGYGGRLFLLLRSYPVESFGRTNKLHEVGLVTSICSSCFLFRAAFLLFGTYTSNTAIDADALFLLGYYTLVEILPSGLVLYILRKLPPKTLQLYSDSSHHEYENRIIAPTAPVTVHRSNTFFRNQRN
eukprot:TRINITY_DN5558_c0_g1_i1.p1 TRINITY_DN5558_c0_g1~~TRINITY_DN5558_c0_g1_i1.p1  ORF type:complete len:230 (-),score=10.85 TRINITY_DN5558_c0_g1_i1:99-788(-)